VPSRKLSSSRIVTLVAAVALALFVMAKATIPNRPQRKTLRLLSSR